MAKARKRSRLVRALVLLLAVAAVAALGLAMQRPRPWDLDTHELRATAASLRDRLSGTASRVVARMNAARHGGQTPDPGEQVALGPAPMPGLVVADTDSTTASAPRPVSDSTLAAAADSMAVTSTASADSAAMPGTAPADPAPPTPQTADTVTRPETPPSSTVALRIEISLEKRMLWLLRGRDTVLTADIAIGKGTTFEYEGKVYKFVTPKGHLRILSKIEDPMWIPPDWHYYEKAVDRGLEPVFLKPGDRVELSDGSYMEMRGDTVGHVNLRGQWWEWTPGMEVVFDGKIFVPPLSSPQRRIPDALGPYKLGLGNGVFIHGTNPYDEDSIGQAVSHGCIRVTNEQLHEIYSLVKVGTPVYIH